MVRTNAGRRQVSDKERLAKNARIKATGLATRARRADMTPKVFHLKITGNKLTSRQREELTRVFLEAKWLRNAALADQYFKPDYAKTREYRVDVLVRGKGLPPEGVLQERALTVIGSQLAQAVVRDLSRNLSALAAAKAKGRKVGKLKYTSQVDSIDLQQYQTTYRVDTARGRVQVQGIHGWMRVHGLDQLPATPEFSNAKLLRKADGYYLAVTCYTTRREEDFQSGTIVGLDMNVGRPMVLDDGSVIDHRVEETDRLKRLQRKLSRQCEGSNNWWKTTRLIEREYQRISQRKDDLANKVAHDLLRHERVFMQDERLSTWKRRDGFVKGGRKIHHGILGRVKKRLVDHPRVTVLDRWVPTTAWCPACHGKTAHHVSQRSYTCQHCGYHNPDRDQHSAANMILIGTTLDAYLQPVAPNPGLKPVLGKEPLPPEQRDIKPVEIRSSAHPTETPVRTGKSWSEKQEAATSSASP